MPRQPQGEALVRLLKKIADEALVLRPEDMAKELNIPMTFETKPSATLSTDCRVGGSYKTFLVTTAKVGESWYKETPEGMPNMEIPPAFINPGSVAGKPRVGYEMYRTAQCSRPNYTNIESRLSFGNLSGFSCLRPDRLKMLIDAKYEMATDGVSLSMYGPPDTYAYGVTLQFVFRLGAPCALGASVDLQTRDGLREKRAFLKWRACFDNARKVYCEAHGWKATQTELSDHGDGACESREAYIDREPVEGDTLLTWPDFRESSDNPCDYYRPK